MAKQTQIPKVDEDFMKQVISQGFPMKRETMEIAAPTLIEKPIDPPTEVQPRKRKRAEQADYRETFFEKNDFTDRQPLYITRDTHLTLLDIVQVVGGHKATISSYVENIIREHLENHKEEINHLYEIRFKKPVK